MSLHDEIQSRFDKLDHLKRDKHHPYPERFQKNVTARQLHELTEDLPDLPSRRDDLTDRFMYAGRVMTWREHGKLIFAHIQDDTGSYQVAFTKDVLGKSFDELKWIDRGDWLGVTGDVFITQKEEETLLVKSWTFLGKALRPLPEKWHGVKDTEIKYRKRYLDLIMNRETKERFDLRSKLIKTLREFYWQEGFTEVETPVLLHSATGANAKPYITHNNGLDIDVFLRISHELPLKELIVGGYEKVFEIGKAFRNEGIDPSHLPEHTHVEHYAAFWNWEDNVRFTEKMIDHLFETLKLDRKRMILDREEKEQEVDFTTPFNRVDFVELLKKDTGLDITKFTNADVFRSELKKKEISFEGIDTMGLTTLVDNVYKKVSRPKLINPTVVYNYPAYMQPLARRNDENPEIVDQFQIVVNGWEILKAYSELVDPVDQKARFEEQLAAKEGGDEEAMEGDDDYIVAMEHGMPPISGWGMGIDRLVALLTKQPNLRDVVLFPLLRPENSSQSPVYVSADVKKDDIGIMRDVAWQLIEKHVKEDYLQKHALAVEAVMQEFAEHFGEDKDVWGITGLLHDLDYEMTKEDLSQHGQKTAEILQEQGVHGVITNAIQAHNELTGVEPTSMLAKTLYAVEELTGLITACALVQPDKKLSSVNLKSVKKKFKTKSFAKGVNRDIVRQSEDLLDMPLDDVFTKSLNAMQGIADDLGL